MYYTILILYLCHFVNAAVIPEDKTATILRYKYENLGGGNYEFSYDTSNGISRYEAGKLVNVGQDNEHIEVTGIYSYIDPEGTTRSFEYSADENGFHVYPMESIDLRVDEMLGQFSPMVPAVAPQIASLLG